MKTERPLWRIEIDMLEAGLDELGVDPPAPVADLVILRYLREGDIRPLADLLQYGHEPDHSVMDLLAEMLADDGDTTYRLNVVRRDGKKGNKPKPEMLPRDLLLAMEVQLLMRKGQTNEDAIHVVAEAHNHGVELVRTAYKESPKDYFPDGI